MKNSNRFVVVISLLLLSSANLFCMYATKLEAADRESMNKALFIAVKSGNLESIQAAIEEGGADINCQNSEGNTALIEVIQRFGQEDIELEIIRYLISLGANVNIQNDNGRTALMEASMFNKNKIVQDLILADANVNLQDSQGQTALVAALRFINMLKRNNPNSPEFQRFNENIFLHLINAGTNVNINAYGFDRNTALMMSSSRNVALLLLQAGADLTMKNKHGKIAEEVNSYVRAIANQHRVDLAVQVPTLRNRDTQSIADHIKSYL